MTAPVRHLRTTKGHDMTTVYIPRPIRTVEDAEGLPEETIIIHPAYFPQEKFGGLWGREGNSSASLAEEGDWTALVAVEAEEEWAAEFESGEMYANLDEDSARAADGGTAMSRYVTFWEAIEE